MGGHYLASALEEDAGQRASEPVVTLIDLGCGFQTATLKNVFDKINHGQEPDPRMLAEQRLHERLMRALQKTDLYAGHTFIGYRLPKAENAREDAPYITLVAA